MKKKHHGVIYKTDLSDYPSALQMIHKSACYSVIIYSFIIMNSYDVFLID